MFYCNPCAEMSGWPKSSSRWNSVCEMCGELADCNDIPSCALPNPPPSPDDKAGEGKE